MTIEYRGRNLSEGRKHPEAWIFYNDESQAEEKKMDKLIEMLIGMGWECFNEYGMTVIPLYNGKTEYEELLQDYKEGKKMIKKKRRYSMKRSDTYYYTTEN